MNLKDFKYWIDGHDISDRKMKQEINRKEYERQMENRGITIAMIVLSSAILLLYMVSYYIK